MRKIVVSTPASDLAKQINSCATTWGELKNEPDFAKYYHTDHEAILGGSKTTFTRDDAALPTGDFSVFLVATKNKLGAETFVGSLNEAIETAVYSSCEDGDDLEEIIEEVVKAVNTFFANGIEAQMNAAEKAALAEGKQLL